MRLTLAMQLVGFAVYGLFIGDLYDYRYQKEREFTAAVLLATDIKALTQIPVKDARI